MSSYVDGAFDKLSSRRRQSTAPCFIVEFRLALNTLSKLTNSVLNLCLERVSLLEAIDISHTTEVGPIADGLRMCIDQCFLV